jgi:hypothetical protein
MARSASLLRLLLLVPAFACCPGAVAQPPEPRRDPSAAEDPLDGLKRVARAKFEATQADPDETARALLDVAREGFLQARSQNLEGKRTAQAALEWLPRMEAAQRAVDGGEANLGLLERTWEWAWLIDLEQTARKDAGRISGVDWSVCRALLLDQAIRWTEARARRPKPSRTAVPGPLRLEEELFRSDLARAKFDAVRAGPRELRQARSEALLNGCEAAWQIYERGKGTLISLIEAERRSLEAERGLRGADGDSVPILERLWDLAYAEEQMVEGQFASNRCSLTDLLVARLLRLEAEVALARSRAARKEPIEGAAPPFSPLERPEEQKWESFDIARARAKFGASRTDPKELARRRHDTAREAYESCLRIYEGGRGTLRYSLTLAGRLAAAESALASERAGAATLLEKAWRRALSLEPITEDRLAAGRVDVGDLLELRYVRLTLQLEWARARKRSP